MDAVKAHLAYFNSMAAPNILCLLLMWLMLTDEGRRIPLRAVDMPGTDPVRAIILTDHSAEPILLHHEVSAHRRPRTAMADLILLLMENIVFLVLICVAPFIAFIHYCIFLMHGLFFDS